MIEQRFEYACIDNASLLSVPPVYPQPLDVYQAGYVGSVADAYGIVPIGSTGAALPLGVPAGATCIVLGDATNTSPVVLAQLSVVRAPNTQGVPMWWAVNPNQLVTLPGVLNTGNIVVQAITPAGAITTAVPFAAQVMWQL
jgi:hypothetical protein